MQKEQILSFGPYRLELTNEQLRRGKQSVKVTGKAFAVLRCLIERTGQLVTKEELFQLVWSETVVSDAALTSCIKELRRALQDNAKAPRYIETVHRRGYRFVAPLRTNPSPVQSSTFKVQSPQPPVSRIVGREDEMRQLYSWFEEALSGKRQVIFVTGEPGIGKTAVVDAFAEQVAREHEVWIGYGQCVEQYGAGEAYLPILDAFGRLGRQPGGARLVALLRQHAPAWLAQMPALLTVDERESLQREVMGATRERMLREMLEALEVMAGERAVVFVLEDLHWSDSSTIELLGALARRREAARVFVLATYRPAEVLVHEHPLRGIKQELEVHGNCHELVLNFLSAQAVNEYLQVRFPDSQFPAKLAQMIHQRTDGNPLFIVNVTNDLVIRGVIAGQEGRWDLHGQLDEIEKDIPESLRQLIWQQIERIDVREQEILEAASVAGTEFSAAAVAAGVDTGVEEVEKHCETFVRRAQFLQAAGIAEWPDGTIAVRYAFIHALYQEVLHERVHGARRVRLHQQIGEKAEAAYGSTAREIAPELAVHFERSRDTWRAVQYLEYAGQNALRRSAHQEAIHYLSKGLDLLRLLPDTPQRMQQELTLQRALGSPLTAVQGYAAPEVEQVYNRARELCQQIGETPQLFPVLWGLCVVYHMRGELRRSRELGEQLLHLAQQRQDAVLQIGAREALGVALLWVGEFAPARLHLEQGSALYDVRKRRAIRAVQDPGVDCLSFSAMALWCLGYPDQARKKAHAAVQLAQELDHPYSQLFACVHLALFYLKCRDVAASQEWAKKTIAACEKEGWTFFGATGAINHGWALAMQGRGAEGIAQVQHGLAIYRTTKSGGNWPLFLLCLAEAYGKAGQLEEGLATLDEALAVAEKNEERWWEAELHRLRGEILLNDERGTRNDERQKKAGAMFSVQHSSFSIHRLEEVEACFERAIAIAQHQEAKSWELRATMSLSRLWQKQGKTEEARQLLAEIYGWFTEGFDTADLKETKALLAELASS